MKITTKITGLFLLVIMLAALCASCGDDEDNNRYELSSASGNVDGKADWDCFGLYTEDQSIDVVFTWPRNADFMVTVFGRDQNYLGEFHLREGNTINLTGGGQFFLLVHCLNSTGAWSASW